MFSPDSSVHMFFFQFLRHSGRLEAKAVISVHMFNVFGRKGCLRVFFPILCYDIYLSREGKIPASVLYSLETGYV